MSKQNEFSKQFNMSPKICKALDALGYHKPTKVQNEVMKDLQLGKDLIMQSKTGSGKTAAFGIPVLDALDVEENLPQVLVLTPTRELAVQVCEELGDIGKYKKIRCLPVYGKQPIHIQLRQLKQRVHVVVGTPGRLGDLIRKKHLKLEEVKYLVIDEADELLKRGFIEEVNKIIARVPKERVTILLSATMPQEIEEVCSEHMVNPIRIEVESEEEPIEQIRQSYMEVADDWKLLRLMETIEYIGPKRGLIFCNTRNKVDQVTKKMKNRGYSCGSIHGQMAQKYRLRAIADFKEEKIQFLVATDLVGRGIHIDKLDLVINYQVPKDSENYVHRIGRTGRAGEKGQAVTFVNVHEQKDWEEIQTFIGYCVPRVELKKGKKNQNKSSRDHKIEKPNSNNRNGNHASGNRSKKYKDIQRIRINVGKKKKIRLGDIVGAVSNLPSIDGKDIGIIDIQETCSYIEIHNNKGKKAFEELQGKTVKGKPVSVKLLKG